MLKSEIIKRFGKARLLDIANELGMPTSASTHSWKIIQAIIDDLDENGVPEDEDLSNDLFDFLVAISYITEKGVIIEESDKEEPDEEEEDEQKGDDSVNLPEDLPDCWGQGDKDVPACRTCPILKQCWSKRLKARKTRVCFGSLYDEGAEDCKICVEWKYCKPLTVAK